MHRPTAVPRMPASASGVSKQRSGPKRSRSPTVARKTPPARPTSSPITITEWSRASSTCSASLTASTIDSSANDALQLLEIRAERRGRIDVRVREEQFRIRRRRRLSRGNPRAHRVGRLPTHRLRELVVEDARAPQIALVASEALALLLLLDPLEVDVRALVVRGRVRHRPIGERFDERRPFPPAGAFDGLAR